MQSAAATFTRVPTKDAYYIPPAWLTSQVINPNARYEIDRTLAYIKKKYGY